MFNHERLRNLFAWPIQDSHVCLHRVGDRHCDLRRQNALQAAIPYVELSESRMTIGCSPRSILGSYCIRLCDSSNVWLVPRDFVLDYFMLMGERLKRAAKRTFLDPRFRPAPTRLPPLGIKSSP
jgi:hypothetical protein